MDEKSCPPPWLKSSNHPCVYSAPFTVYLTPPTVHKLALPEYAVRGAEYTVGGAA